MEGNTAGAVPVDPERKGGEDAETPRVTVVCSPRDHYHDAVESLAVLLRDTDEPFDLIYVIGRAPKDVLAHVRQEAARVGFRLIERDRHLVPNHARNLALAEVRTEYAAFVDNDAFVSPGWLSALLRCADETGAAVVGPLQLIGPAEEGCIHLTGGFIDIDESVTPHPITITHRHQWRTLAELDEPLARERCDFAEWHCLLARTDVLAEVGPLDEGLLSLREVEDLGLKVRAIGRECWFEPSAVVAFRPPSRVRLSEIGLISRRWGERANRQSFERFLDRYELDHAHMSAIGFTNGIRRSLFWPVRGAITRLGMPNLARKVEYVLHRIERPINRVLVRPGSTSL